MQRVPLFQLEVAELLVCAAELLPTEDDALLLRGDPLFDRSQSASDQIDRRSTIRGGEQATVVRETSYRKSAFFSANVPEHRTHAHPWSDLFFPYPFLLHWAFPARGRIAAY